MSMSACDLLRIQARSMLHCYMYLLLYGFTTARGFATSRYVDMSLQPFMLIWRKLYVCLSSSRVEGWFR